MKDGFTRKKVESLTLGEKLKKLRSDFRMSLSEISKITKIQVKYLEYLENGQYDKLPADVYVRGFLRSYARYLNIDEGALIKLYERECNIQANLNRDVAKKTFTVKNLDISALVITPRSIVIMMIFLLVGGAFLYLYREFRSFAGVPRLVILAPANGAVVEASEVIVQGKTDKGARVSINNQPVFVGIDGEFSDKLILQPGLNTVTVVSINRFDKEKSETLSIEAQYTPSAPSAQTDETNKANRPEMFRIDVGVLEPTKVTLEADGTIVFSGILKPGELQKAEAKERAEISSDNAVQTLTSFNGAAAEPLGSERVAVKDIIFTAAGKQR
ncbi:MAG: helix-turn-helix domain-containing protein [Candidatus Moraniibacteriota bacterium]